MSFRFDEAELRELAKARLHRVPPAEPRLSDDDLNPDVRVIDPGKVPRPAAVLVPLVAGEGGLDMLLTLRTDHLTSHAGQIAFPGGRIDAADDGPVAAALRETEEETGIGRDFVEPLGFLDTYLTVTSYRVFPVVALLRPGFNIVPHAHEVSDIFRVPLSFLMNPAHHERHSRDWQGALRYYYAMAWRDRYIWGATAAMIRNLYHHLYEP